MFASFIVFFHTRRWENLQQTLRFLELWHLDVIQESEIVTICQDKIDFHLLTHWKNHLHLNLNLEQMHLPKMINTGVSLAKSNNLVILESDRILPKNYFKNHLIKLQEGMQITTRKMIKLTKYFTDCDIQNDHFTFINDNRVDQVGGKNMWSGNTIITKKDFDKIGGMDEFYKGYGWADNDMCEKTKNLQFVFGEEREIHLWHEPATYGTGDQKQMFIDNGLYFCKKWNLPLPFWFKKEIISKKSYIL